VCVCAVCVCAVCVCASPASPPTPPLLELRLFLIGTGGGLGFSISNLGNIGRCIGVVSVVIQCNCVYYCDACYIHITHLGNIGCIREAQYIVYMLYH
jgi:hypothetical protein